MTTVQAEDGNGIRADQLYHFYSSALRTTGVSLSHSLGRKPAVVLISAVTSAAKGVAFVSKSATQIHFTASSGTKVQVLAF